MTMFLWSGPEMFFVDYFHFDQKIMKGLGELFGGRGAEAGVYIPDETLDKMSIDEVLREIELLGPPMFGMSVGPNYIQHLRDLANALEKKIEE